jgi:hypothetical protein
VVVIAMASAAIAFHYHKVVDFSGFLPARMSEKIRAYAAKTRGDSFVKIVVYPWAKVFIDGKYVDTTPIADPVRLKPGEHTLSFSHSTFKSKTIKIILKPGETRLLSVRLGS